MTAVTEAADPREDLAVAEQLLEDLKERVRDGDETVTPADVTEVQDRVTALREFAELRAEAAQRRMSRAAEERRQEAGRQLRADVDALADADRALAERVKVAAAALRDLEVAARVRVQVVEDLLERALAVGDAEDFGITPGRTTATAPYAVRTPGRDVRQVPASAFLRLAVHRGVTKQLLQPLKTDLTVPPTQAGEQCGLEVAYQQGERA